MTRHRIGTALVMAAALAVPLACLGEDGGVAPSPTALLVAKLHKIEERRGSTRLVDKDALDVLRLLRGTPTADLSTRLRLLLTEPPSRDPARLALPWLRELFAVRRGEGIRMAQRAAGGLVDEAEIEAASLALASDLLDAIEG